MADSKYDVRKIIILGNQEVGKSCLLQQWVDVQFSAAYIATIGIDFKIKNMDYPASAYAGKTPLKLQIWDTAGQERFRMITESYYRAAHFAMLVFDVTNRASFEKLPDFLKKLKEVSPNLPCMVIANKIDLADERRVSQEESFAYAESIGAIYIETSGKTAQGVKTIENAMIQHFAATQQNTSSKEALVTEVRFADLRAKIGKFEADWAHNERMTHLAKTLKGGLDIRSQQFYFEQKLPDLQADLDQLRSTCKTLFNTALNLVITVLLALTIVGLPLAYCTGLLSANEKTNGHMLTFFALGEQQVARALCIEVLEKSGTTLRI
jgi:small GTP-binding protein